MKLTLEQLIERKLSNQDKGNFVKEVELACLGGAILIKKIPLTKIINCISEIENAGTEAKFDAFIEIVYNCCPIMQEKKLQEAYECGEPTDIVCRLLDDNVGALVTLATEILAMYGMDSENLMDKLKN
ncbi:MAG: hypothetical protein IJ056_04965 [Acidaminococcaceae bacterium]|nr:hypothetical protein [Acidaminococcaceae bacterium]MBQ9634686.1 hypothetical protein [Acidaminococcaceae bacterium]